MQRTKHIMGCALLLMASASQATLIEMNFRGNAGAGLLPGNENPAVPSAASGGEVGGGLVYDDVTNTLSLEFEFAGLTGGLFDAADGGIHLHDAGAADPFGANGPIEINLNSGFANVAFGSLGGMVDLDVVLTDAQEIELLNGQYYLNIHSDVFRGGELRGNLVRAIAEPGSALLLLAGLAGLGLGRRK